MVPLKLKIYILLLKIANIVCGLNIYSDSKYIFENKKILIGDFGNYPKGLKLARTIKECSDFKSRFWRK